MQDASKSGSTAISTLFPDAIILYCYFHLKDINRRNLPKNDVPAAFRKEILSDIDDMHYCTTYEQFVYVSKSKVDKWYYNKLNKYADYFVEQWLTPPFDKWQLFRRPAGYAPTNGCEPINKRIKQDYLPDRKKLHIIDAFQMLEKLVFVYSNDRAKFNFYPTMITSDMKKKK
jgi:hypothetical protein